MKINDNSTCHLSETKKDKLIDVFIEKLKLDDEKCNHFPYINTQEADFNASFLLKELENHSENNNVIKAIDDLTTKYNHIEMTIESHRKSISNVEESLKNVDKDI